ncbi:S58 family peptidase [Thermoleophilia bacterium SCSIO 60948]|nr:S58 family peptidase [Thermoleophilia bacterium SCSIO 60948]
MAERWRALAGPIGVLPTGERNAITDVAGVRVGHSQSSAGERSGVTVVAPPRLPAAAGMDVVNGVGELVAGLDIAERGRIETPVYLCGTHALGTVTQAAIELSGRGPQDSVIPVVGECDDGDLADSRRIVPADVDAATAALGAAVAEGNVGAGTGMVCFGYPGGIGTASRRAGEHTVGVLALCNFGEREYLDLLGANLPPAPKLDLHGSCIAVCATDAPLDPLALRRLALRPLLGLARVGSYGSEGSGEIGLAFTTAEAGSPLGLDSLEALFAAAYESAHEAVLNCLVAARPAERIDGSMQEPFPTGLVRELAPARGGGERS